jgi:hypothetical protein
MSETLDISSDRPTPVNNPVSGHLRVHLYVATLVRFRESCYLIQTVLNCQCDYSKIHMSMSVLADCTSRLT